MKTNPSTDVEDYGSFTFFSFLFLKHFHHFLLFIYNCAQYASAQEGELPSQEEVRAMFEKVRVPGWPWS